jgi:ribosomal protein S10
MHTCAKALAKAQSKYKKKSENKVHKQAVALYNTNKRTVKQKRKASIKRKVKIKCTNENVRYNVNL